MNSSLGKEPQARHFLISAVSTGSYFYRMCFPLNVKVNVKGKLFKNDFSRMTRSCIRTQVKMRSDMFSCL